MSVDYEAVRKTLAGLLQANVSAAQAVHDHEPGDLGTASPVLVVSRRGRGRDPLTFDGHQTHVQLYVDAYFLAAESASGGYTYADGADVVDLVAAQIDALIDNSQVIAAAGWEAVSYDGDSTIEGPGMFNADGIVRWRERLPLSLILFA